MHYKWLLRLHLCSRGTDEVFQALDDNQMKLQAMKASRFVKAFEQDVDHWECTLSLISEVVEMLLTVQRQWMYLEVAHTCLPQISYLETLVGGGRGDLVSVDVLSTHK